MISGSLIKQMKRTNEAIVVNSNEVYVNHILHTNDEVCLMVGFDDERSENIPIIQGDIDIVFENEDVLIVNKPANMPTHPSLHHYEDSLASIVLGYYEQKGQSFVFRCVNRLDKGTSGLCVIAKHAHAHEILKKQLHSGDFERKYVAIVKGEIDGEGFVEAPIKRCSDSCIERMVAEDGDYAYTAYKRMKYDKSADLSLVELVLKTGRTHQIRVHMAHIGHSLLGDFLYGEESSLIERPALHSSQIKLLLPITNQRIEIASPLPNDFDII